MKYLGVDVGSTTVKAVVMEDGKVTWQDYQRHNTRQAEKVVEFLDRMETEAGVTAGQDRIFFTGSGAGFLAPLAAPSSSRKWWRWRPASSVSIRMSGSCPRSVART
jgi:predicted NBD/HSP70 family sugar kinase